MTSRMVCSVLSRDAKDAVSHSVADQRRACSVVPGIRARHGGATAAASSGPRVLAVDKSRPLPSDESPSSDSNSTPFRKRKVAMWVGYVGTAFKGEGNCTV